jgi:hypothetical protein
VRKSKSRGACDVCSMAWRYGSLAARRSQHGRVASNKITPDGVVDFDTAQRVAALNTKDELLVEDGDAGLDGGRVLAGRDAQLRDRPSIKLY